MRGLIPVSALKAERVSKRYGSVVALDQVSLEVERGECVALIGESGSGKTTLLRCFNRLTDPDEGRVLVEGATSPRLDPIELRRRTGYVPQDGGLLPHWRVRRNVALVPWLRGESDETAARPRPLAWWVSSPSNSASAGPASCPAASGSGSRWPGRSPPVPRWCCSTSRSARSTRSPAPISNRPSRPFAASSGSPRCW